MSRVGEHQVRRKPFVREVHRERAVDLYLLGKTHHEIAEELGISRRQVGHDLSVVDQRLRTQAEEHLQARRNKARARHVAWARWAVKQIEQYSGTREVTMTRQRRRGKTNGSSSDDAQDQTSEAMRRTEVREPPAALLTFLNEQLQAIDKIDGVFRPEQHVIAGALEIREVWYEQGTPREDAYTGGVTVIGGPEPAQLEEGDLPALTPGHIAPVDWDQDDLEPDEGRGVLSE